MPLWNVVLLQDTPYLNRRWEIIIESDRRSGAFEAAEHQVRSKGGYFKDEEIKHCQAELWVCNTEVK